MNKGFSDSIAQMRLTRIHSRRVQLALSTRSQSHTQNVESRLTSPRARKKNGALVPEEVILKRISEPRSFDSVLNATLIAITMYRHESLNRVEEPIGGGAEVEGTTSE